MIYPVNFEQKIGFDTIRQLIKAKCLSLPGEEKVVSMAFSSDYSALLTQLNQTNEFVRILSEEDAFPSAHFYDVRDSLKKIRIEGTYLTEAELFDIRRSLQTIDEIVRFFRVRQDDQSYPYLLKLIDDVYIFPKIIDNIDKILTVEGEIKENASAALAAIRKELFHTQHSISKTLQRILRQAQSEGFVDKEAAPTIRSGRLMIPIAPSFKRKLQGIVHDESASGKTVFIEPAEVVEANNRVRELEYEEKREIIRILTAMTDRIRPEIPTMQYSYNILAEIDFIRAKALFALDLQAIFPVFENKQQLDWIGAVHPLLYLSHRKQEKAVVPLEIALHPDHSRILIISGPNAGGKSVCLKTVGLLQYMLQCGLLIPVTERSQTGIFDAVFIDIGDEQSIENDLSTYSSHLTNMKYFVRHCNSKTLILIDEFGSGTEPQIGGAIAEVLLDRFNRKLCFGVITTHYQNLKQYAEKTDGIVNGAMLYDNHLMQPLFRLAIGNPGSSFAIEIARKIGLAEDVIADVSEIVGKDYIAMDKYLQEIVRDKRYWEEKRRNIRQQEKRLEELTERYQSDLKALETQYKDIIKQAKTEATHLLSETNAKIENTIKEIREVQAEKTKTKTIRKSLDAYKDAIAAEPDLLAKLHPIKNPALQRKKAKKPAQTKPIRPEMIQKGDVVRLKGQQSEGEVLEVKGKNAVVVFGMIKSMLKIDQIERVTNPKARKTVQQNKSLGSYTMDLISQKRLNFKMEIDVRGMRADEALQAVMYYIDDAIQCGAGRVRILHGTGTGALRQVIREYLKTIPAIRSFQDEHVQFGGTGITVVEFE
ncbi:MAG: Smr/MutS family protein [Dysgonamonadaceae bacterium]|jgi:DNA mismatch repair protein MutS2|nr:Smr/MutS family protein [Dysgonamonadaceae bacterium]